MKHPPSLIGKNPLSKPETPAPGEAFETPAPSTFQSTLVTGPETHRRNEALNHEPGIRPVGSSKYSIESEDFKWM